MTDDPSKAFVTPGRTHHTMPTPTNTLTRDVIRAALVELLTIGQHHHAGTPTTLTAIGNTRRALATQHGIQNPAAHSADDHQRLAALSQALATVGGAVIAVPHPRRPDTAGLHDGLTELAAVTLGWLDTLPNPSHPDDEPI